MLDIILLNMTAQLKDALFPGCPQHRAKKQENSNTNADEDCLVWLNPPLPGVRKMKIALFGRL